MIPFIKYFCMLKKIMSTGMSDSVIVAVSVPYCQDAASSRKKVMPTANGRAAAVVVNVFA